MTNIWLFVRKIVLVAACVSAAVADAQFLKSDTWAVTDALGRKALQDPDSVKLRKEKEVAIFYWTWHQWNYPQGITDRNVSKIQREQPEAMESYDHPAWKNWRAHYFWEEPLLGYYSTFDPWVLRKHAEMLADAKVDAVFFDCTNGDLTWDKSYKTLLRVWHQARLDGVNTPKIAFMLPFGYSDNSKKSLTRLYNELYKPGLYKDLWYYWDGKPVIMAYCDNFDKNVPEEKEILDFFTYRPGQPDYVNGPANNPNWKQWGWLEVYPQHGYVKTEKGYEQVTVGMAQNTSDATNGHCSAFNVDGSYGRSYSKLKGFDTRKDAYLYGWNFNEQWSRAFELDPKMVFVTGWNEYVADMFKNGEVWKGRNFAFVDQFDWDHSRDIEPNKGWGSKGDVYYYMLVDKVRRFKGIEKPEKVSEAKTIKIDCLDEWKDVKPVYKDYRGDVMHRYCSGAFNITYTNNTGRNDIVEARVARDNKNVYFYVRTDSLLSSRSDKNWMVLFVDIDRDKNTGWEGYDFSINRQTSSDGYVSVEKGAGNDWNWKAVGKAKVVVYDKAIVISVPRELMECKGKKLDFEFKWSDNMQEEGNPMDFYVNGDVAPSARFNYVYCE